jgi:hypothetical protein
VALVSSDDDEEVDEEEDEVEEEDEEEEEEEEEVVAADYDDSVRAVETQRNNIRRVIKEHFVEVDADEYIGVQDLREIASKSIEFVTKLAINVALAPLLSEPETTLVARHDVDGQMAYARTCATNPLTNKRDGVGESRHNSPKRFRSNDDDDEDDEDDEEEVRRREKKDEEKRTDEFVEAFEDFDEDSDEENDGGLIKGRKMVAVQKAAEKWADGHKELELLYLEEFTAEHEELCKDLDIDYMMSNFTRPIEGYTFGDNEVIMAITPNLLRLHAEHVLKAIGKWCADQYLDEEVLRVTEATKFLGPSGIGELIWYEALLSDEFKAAIVKEVCNGVVANKCGLEVKEEAGDVTLYEFRITTWDDKAWDPKAKSIWEKLVALTVIAVG